MTRPERQELLHVFIRRIDVGSSFLTIHWSFSDDVARISRSKAMPKKGTVPETVACPIANTLTGETSVAGNEVVLSTTSQTGEVERLQKQVDNSRNTNSQTSIDEGSEKGKNVVEIGAIDSLGVQQGASYGLLLGLLPNLPSDAERRPSKQREAPRVRRAKVYGKQYRRAGGTKH